MLYPYYCLFPFVDNFWPFSTKPRDFGLLSLERPALLIVAFLLDKAKLPAEFPKCGAGGSGLKNTLAVCLLQKSDIKKDQSFPRKDKAKYGYNKIQPSYRNTILKLQIENYLYMNKAVHSPIKYLLKLFF